MEYESTNHNQLAPRVYRDLQQVGLEQSSRNGPVLRMPGCTTLWVSKPRERVNFCGARDANPFFHLVEAAAMLANANDVELLAHMAKNMRAYSDDGERYNAFYGERLRQTWGDQLNQVILELTDKPDSRQALAQIWDPRDLVRQTKDKACNLCLIFQVEQDGSLGMTSFNRSNDAVWGILSGANVVHLSVFQEYVACALGRPVGPWSHVSANLHVYTANPQWAAVKDAPVADYYAAPSSLGTGPLLFDRPEQRVRFDVDLRHAVAAMQHGVKLGDLKVAQGMFHKVESGFLKDVLAAFLAFSLRKARVPAETWQGWLHHISAPDWHLACAMWVGRRATNGGAS